jgi:hypothetical protein
LAGELIGFLWELAGKAAGFRPKYFNLKYFLLQAAAFPVDRSGQNKKRSCFITTSFQPNAITTT